MMLNLLMHNFLIAIQRKEEQLRLPGFDYLKQVLGGILIVEAADEGRISWWAARAI